MATLSGNQTGTNGNDAFIGNISLVENEPKGEVVRPSAFPEGAGLDSAVVQAQGGNDRIEGTADIAVGPDVLGTATASGFKDTEVLAGSGSDEIVATGTARDLFGGGITNAFGFQDSKAFGAEGDDTFTISALSESNLSDGSAFLRSFIDAGDGNDVISLDYEAINAEDTPGRPTVPSVSGTGASSSGIRAGDGADTISISAKNETTFFSSATSLFADLKGAVNTLEINGGKGNDVMTTSVDTIAEIATGTGLDNARMLGGEGSDVLEVNVKATGLDRAEVIALTNRSRVSGNEGDDTLTIVSEATANGSSVEGIAIGLTGASLDSGVGSDVVNITVTSQGSAGDSTGIGVENSGIDLDDGNDQLTIDVFSAGVSSGTGVGIVGTTITAGGGNDTISITSDALGEDGVLGDATGAKSSRIFAGNGDDTIKIRASVGFGNVDIDDMLLAGGAGDDTFDAGVGSGQFKGDSGVDTAILDYLGAPLLSGIELSVTESRGRVEIKSNLDTLEFGDALPWTQTFRDVEVFKVSGVDYTASELAATFG